MHHTLKEKTASPPSAAPCTQQRGFYRFIQKYNELRPHEALGQKPPATVYRSSDWICPGLIRRPVGFKQKTDRTWSIHFGPHDFGFVDEYDMKAVKTPVKSNFYPWSTGSRKGQDVY